MANEEVATQAAAPAEQSNVQAQADTQQAQTTTESSVDQNSIDQSNGQVGEQTNDVQNFEEPKNLEEALDQVYELDDAATKKAIQDRQDAESAQQQEQSSESDTHNTRQANSIPAEQQQISQQEQTANQGSGGSADSQPQFNQRAYLQGIENSVMQQARQAAAKELQDNNVKLYDFKDVIDRDEESGTSVFRNPDNGQEFRDRVEAQKWIDTQNAQVKATANNLAEEKAQAIRQSISPAVQTQVFINTEYNNMSDPVKNVFNELIEPYAVNNNQGQRVGFSCNLYDMKDKAVSIVNQLLPENKVVSSTQQQPQAQEKEAPVTTPAVDMNTGSASTKDEYPEPKNLEDAFDIINKIKEKEGK